MKQTKKYVEIQFKVISFKRWQKDAKTFEMSKTAFGNQCLSRACTFEWIKRFKKVRTSVDDDPRSGWLSTRRLTVHDNFAEAGTFRAMCQAILTEDLHMWCVSAKFCPRVLTIELNIHRLPVATNLLQEAENIRTSQKASPQMTRHESANEIRELNISLCGGSRPSLQNRRMCVRWIPMSVMLIFFFLTWKISFVMNTSPKVKHWISITVLKSLNDWLSPFVARY
jgi:hypothetical protein